jgi:hypothetical protein
MKHSSRWARKNIAREWDVGWKQELRNEKEVEEEMLKEVVLCSWTDHNEERAERSVSVGK